MTTPIYALKLKHGKYYIVHHPIRTKPQKCWGVSRVSEGIAKLNELLRLIKTTKLDDKKSFKHNPFYDPIKQIEFKTNNSGSSYISIKYCTGVKHNITSILDNEINKDEPRGFSLATHPSQHISNICDQLTDKIKFESMYGSPNYTADDVVKYDKTPKGCRYRVSICPIYGFVFCDGKFKIADRYVLCLLRMFYAYSNTITFETMLSRSEHIRNIIRDFNVSDKTISLENIKHVVNNMRTFVPEFKVTNNRTNSEISYSTPNIDGAKVKTTTSSTQLEPIDQIMHQIIPNIIENLFNSAKTRVMDCNGHIQNIGGICQFPPIHPMLQELLDKV